MPEIPEDMSVLPWVVIAFIWFWGLVPHAVGQLRVRLVVAERDLKRAHAELKRADARLIVLENRASRQHREIRERREKTHGPASEPGEDELGAASFLADIVQARQDVEPPQG